MSLVKAWDVAYVRFSAPDLVRMRAFLLDFGLSDASTPDGDSDRLFMRGGGRQPFLHSTTLGPPGFAGFGVQLTSETDLRELAAAEGCPVETLDAPGGGLVVRLTDPDGYRVEAVFGQKPVEALPGPPRLPWNDGGVIDRPSRFRRVAKGPSHVLRLGHVVLGVTDFRRSEAWYKERFGLITSDEIQPAPGHAIGAFMRCDRGETPCDHHTIFILQRPGPPPPTAAFMHAAFEVAGLDDLMAGHAHLERAKAEAAWGVGRHLLGSQVFDYWKDPWGHEVEHWTDGDQLRARDGGGIASIPDLIGVQWGMPIPPHPGVPTAET
jgi:catechol 2,3-dioxygenase-like lactoylglutathione lyase family enzyme